MQSTDGITIFNWPEHTEGFFSMRCTGAGRAFTDRRGWGARRQDRRIGMFDRVWQIAAQVDCSCEESTNFSDANFSKEEAR